MLLDTVNVYVSSCHELNHSFFFFLFFTASGFENDTNIGQFQSQTWIFYCKFEMETGLWTRRAGLCTSIAKSVSW